MYFPYLRGRQFELIAVRELIEKQKLSSKVIPIIEPVKLSSTLSKTISIAQSNHQKIAVILNPQVGSLLVDAKKDKAGQKLRELHKQIIECDSVVKTVIAAKDSAETLHMLVNSGIELADIIGVYVNREYTDIYESEFARKSLYNVVPYDSSFRRVRGKRIMISDRFDAIKKERNNDYKDVPDVFFSDDHLYYMEDNYIGFSDFSVVGQDYQETGFAPYAVAIHIVYLDEQNKSFRVHHFVSDSNDDISDPANKFYEAVSKLVEWNSKMKLSTLGMREFERLHKEGAYPGLGVVKKLSIMHHLEFVGNYLEDESK